jgi:alpha-glucosidase
VLQIVTITTKPKGSIDVKSISNGLLITGRGDDIEIVVENSSKDYTEFSVSRKEAKHQSQDCIDLGKTTNWFGGNQQRGQYFPIQTIKHVHSPYLSKEEINKAISERYWLNSNGIYFYVELETPLFVDQNNDYIGQLCLEAKKSLPFDIYHEFYNFKYRIGVADNAKTAHKEAISRYLGKPSGYPDPRMVRKPVFSTWAKYKRDVNEAVVREYAKEILDNGYEDPQLEIDDDWETCYGSLEFRKSKFPNPKKLMEDLKKDGIGRITIWTHPFINKGCEPWYSEAESKGYFVANHEGNTNTTWWCSGKDEAAYIDFTKPEAANWYVNRLKRLQEEDGIDAFKFDAGETSWSPGDPVLNATWELSPNPITVDYVTTVSQFGGLIEVRSGQGTQNLPMFGELR